MGATEGKPTTRVVQPFEAEVRLASVGISQGHVLFSALLAEFLTHDLGLDKTHLLVTVVAYNR